MQWGVWKLGYWQTFFGIIAALLLVAFMIINPTLTIKSAAQGISLWYHLVLPALFPFFVASELLVQLGFVRLIGWLLEPATRPLFRLPGASSLVIAMGFASGFPVGAFLTRRLLDEQLLTAEEAERLVSFTNNASPLFILGTVAVGMFGSPAAGYVLAASHYLSNLTVGFIWGRLVGGFGSGRWRLARKDGRRRVSFSQLAHDLQGRSASFGQIMGDSIRKGMVSIAGVGGFIVMFAVITNMLQSFGLIDLIARLLQQLTPGVHLPYSLAYGLGVGFFEMTLGTRCITASEAPFVQQLIAVSAVMAWSGLSIISQVMSIVAGTPLRLSFYLRSRLLQVGLASVFTYAGYLALLSRRTVQVFPGALCFDLTSCSFGLATHLYLLIVTLVVLSSACVISAGLRFIAFRR